MTRWWRNQSPDDESSETLSSSVSQEYRGTYIVFSHSRLWCTAGGLPTSSAPRFVFFFNYTPVFDSRRCSFRYERVVVVDDVVAALLVARAARSGGIRPTRCWTTMPWASSYRYHHPHTAQCHWAREDCWTWTNIFVCSFR